jgi:hypothetical protein
MTVAIANDNLFNFECLWLPGKGHRNKTQHQPYTYQLELPICLFEASNTRLCGSWPTASRRSATRTVGARNSLASGRLCIGLIWRTSNSAFGIPPFVRW